MSNTRRSNSRNSSKKKKETRNTNKVGRNNYQDRFADREFNKGVKAEERKVSSKFENDASWYTRYAQLTKDVGSFPFAEPVGMVEQYEYQEPIDTTIDATANRQNTAAFTVPGFMKLTFVPTIGNTSSPNDPINVAGNTLFTDVKNKTSARTDFEMPDVMKYIVGLDSMYILYSKLRRAYGITKWYSFTNKYVPLAILQNMGFNTSMLRSNLNDFRALINNFALSLNALYMPKGISMVDRHLWMSDNIYKDSETTKAQLYFYDPVELLQFEEGTDETESGSILYYVDIPNFQSLDQIETFINQLYNAFYGSQDMRIISGYFSRAFGEGNSYAIPPVSEDYAVEPVFSKEVLSQFENATIITPSDGNKYRVTGYIYETTGINEGYLANTVGCNVTSSTPEIAINIPQFISPNFLARSNKTVNFHWENVTPEDMLVATRMSNLGLNGMIKGVTIPHSDVTTLYTLAAHGTEVCLDAYVYQFNTAGSVEAHSIGSQILFSIGESHAPSSVLSQATAMFNHETNQIQAVAILSKFDWHPEVDLYGIRNIQVQPPEVGINHMGNFWDLDVFTILNERNFKMLHRIALLSELSCSTSGFQLKE